MIKIAIFASGSGSNAQNIINYFKQRGTASVDLVLTDNPEAGVLQRAQSLGVESFIFSRAEFSDGQKIVELLGSHGIDYIVLAGFLRLIPLTIIHAYEGRIINIHPALLPRHGGKGMYGDRVHQSVVESGDKQTGITIHHVNEVYDSGAVIAQFKVDVLPQDTPQCVAAKVHELEYEHFPSVIEAEIALVK